MASAIDGILLAHQPAIARVDARPNQLLKEWLGKGTFVPRSDANSKALILERVDWDGLSEAMASDVDRLSRAGRETLQVTTCVGAMPKASAWILIQAYYASFYFAQSTLRICGISPSYYNPTELNNLRRILDAYNVTIPFPLKGQLLVELDGITKSVKISPNLGSASHESTWFEFSNLIARVDSLTRSSNLDAAEKIEVLGDLTRLKNAISGYPLHESKLSSIRNGVQYRQELGGWHPYSNPTNSSELKRRIESSLNSREMLSEYEIGNNVTSIRFLESCLLICHVGRHVLSALQKNYGSGFLKNGFCKLDRIYSGKN